ncbi:unnamed protein product [Discosporangium mesarthrocarpum]
MASHLVAVILYSSLLRTQAAEGIQSLTIETGEIGSGYTIPGQFVQIKVGDNKPGFFAIASAPNTDGTMEFLIKETESTQLITTAKAGSTVDMSQVMGKGFDVKENFDSLKYDFPTQNIILMATGTGIAPIRAVIESNILESKNDPFGRSCRLYYGVQTMDKLPYMDKLKEWEANGMEVVPVMSQAGEDWTGRRGYIQAALEEDGVNVPRNSGFIMVGQQDMVKDVKELATKAGVFEGRLLTNF